MTLSKLLEAERYARQLMKTSLFSGMTERQIRTWLDAADVSVQEYATGEYLFRRKDTIDRLGIILRGSADVSRVSEDGCMYMSTLKKNDLFGAASLFGGSETFVTDIRCNEAVRAMFIGEEEMLSFLSENRVVLQNFLRYLNSRIRYLNKRLDAFSKNTIAARVMTYFEGEANNRVCQVKNYTKLSESLCVSRATLYRALDALEASGQIHRNGKQITILEE